MLLVANLLKYGSYKTLTCITIILCYREYYIAISVASDNFYHAIANAILVIHVGR